MLQVPSETSSRARVDSNVQVEMDAATLRQELEAARQALRMQTARRRQVDAALSRRLERKELEIQRWKTLRDQQLNHVMRALLVMEAGLRREQRNVRALLGERDAVIHAQQQEIARLRKILEQQEGGKVVSTTMTDESNTVPKLFQFDCDVKPDLISSLGISHFNRGDDKSVTPTATDNEDSQSNLDSLQLSFYEVGSQPESLMSNLSTQSCNGDVSEGGDPPRDPTNQLPRLSPLKPAQEANWSDSNSVAPLNNNNYLVDPKSARGQDIINTLKKLEVNVHMEQQYHQKNILSPVKEEGSLSFLSASNSPVRCNPCDDQKTSPASPNMNYQDPKPSPSTLLQEVRISGRHKYEDNPVLNCVNQILLRDQEEFLEEQRTLRLKEQEKCKKEAEALNNKKLTKSTENLSLLSEQIIVQHSPVKGKVYSPIDNVSTIHVTEQLIKHSNQSESQEDHYKNIDNYPSPRKRTPPKECLQVKCLPPALPPKPQRLLLSKPLDQKTIINSILPQLNGSEGNVAEMIKNRGSLPTPSNDNELYVISNSAIDDDLLQQLQGRRIKSCSDLPVSLIKSKQLTKSRESIYAPVLTHPTHKPPARPKTSLSPQCQNEKSPKKSSKDDDPTKTTPKKNLMSPNSCIKVASPVSSLINSVDAIEPSKDEENGNKTSPSVLQIVRRFEDLGTKTPKESENQKTEDNGNNLQKNFEEFHLDECDMDALCGDGRPEGDGAEARLQASAAVLEARISYENFLEATGLSQKSIMTPSRLFSNHKSVLKPKDVKHRSRVKAAAVVDRCSNNTAAPSGSVVRYWTEPFL